MGAKGMRPNRFALRDMTAEIKDQPRSLAILDVGSCEPLKAVVHSVALGLCALMGLYNAAAWMRRRQSHLAINAVIYLAATCWEQRHVSHHLAGCPPSEDRAPVPVDLPESTEPKAA